MKVTSKRNVPFEPLALTLEINSESDYKLLKQVFDNISANDLSKITESNTTIKHSQEQKSRLTKFIELMYNNIK